LKIPPKISFPRGQRKTNLSTREGGIGDVVVEMKEITKTFPGVVANDAVNFDVAAGEVHALLGENGAGKTTLMNILYGLYKPDKGEIYLHGQKVDIKSPADAIKRNIGMVHQIFKQVPRHTVAENIALTASHDFFFPVRKVRGKILRIAEEFGLRVDPDAAIWQLSAAERQKVELLKVLCRGAQILILDEPTATLTPQGKRDLFSNLQAMKEKGYAIIFITHKLDEVLEISNRCTVLRKGKKVTTVFAAEVTKRSLARWMVGRDILFKIERPPVEKGKPVLEVKNLCVLGDRGVPAVQNVSFSIREGEILGIAGVGGSGQGELIEALTGLRKIEEGQLLLSGEDLTNASPRTFVDAGVAYVPEKRVEVGVIPTMSVKENLILKNYRDPPFSKRSFLNRDAIDRSTEQKISKYNIITPSPEAPVGLLSGGNIQKLILSREISMEPKLLIAAYPTYGLDVGSVESIRELLLKQRERKSALLLISEDLDEIMMMSDRIAVMYEGKIMGITKAGEATREDLGLMMAGTPLEETA
jgi:simple sugar transport system ATP-binding protein